MKRLAITGIAVFIGLICFLVTNSMAAYTLYFNTRQILLNQASEITLLTSEVAALDTALKIKKGSDVPSDLKSVLAYLDNYEGLEIESIKAFVVLDNKIDYVKNISSLTDNTLCDGYEISLAATNVVDFVKYFDDSKMSFHSLDFLYNTNKATLRIRTGGGI